MTHTYCRAFGSEAVTTCFYDLCLSRLGLELLTFRLRGEHSNRLRHCREKWLNIVNCTTLNYYGKSNRAIPKTMDI